MKILLLTSFLTIFSFQAIGQELTYSNLSSSSDNLKQTLSSSEEYFSGGSPELPYFQGKYSNSYIKFYKSLGTTVLFDIKSQQEYIKLIREIQSSANFRFKFCTDYNEPVVYNYEASNSNKIRFNFSEMRISVDYPSKVNSLIDQNFGLTTAFVCLSDDAYAFHTNLRCEGLGNCESDIAKSNISEAKKYNYRFCEICTNDDY